MANNEKYPTSLLFQNNVYDYVCGWGEGDYDKGMDEIRLELAEGCAMEPEDIEDDRLQRYIYELIDRDWEDLQANLEYSSYKDVPCVVSGRLGLWDGVHSIVPVVCNGIFQALQRIASARFDNNIEVKLEDGQINVTQSHHDGTNYFSINLLNRRGERMADGSKLAEPCYHKKIVGYLF